VAESYWARPTPGEIREAARRTSHAARQLPAAVGSVRLVRCTVAPADEICAWLFEADKVDAIAAVGRAAGLEFDRIAPAFEIEEPPRRTGKRKGYRSRGA
jgi:hypothetical protein